MTSEFRMDRGGATGSSSIDAPRVSFLVAAYNAQDTVSQTLDSLLKQTDGAWEACVVDDGSDDGTLEVVRRAAAADPRIRTATQPNAGTAAARNAAAAMARGSWLVPLDADDYLVPSAVEEQLRFISEHPGSGVYAWGQMLLMPDGSERANRTVVSGPAHRATLKDVAFQRAHIGATLWWARQLFENLGGYRSTYAEDFDLALRAAMAGHTPVVNPARLQVYRVGAVASKTGTGLTHHAQSVIDVLADAEAACPTDDPRCHRTLVDARRQFLSSLSRDEFLRRLRAGEIRGTRGLYLRGLDREWSLSDKWLWAAPIALLSPRLLRPILGRRTATP